MFRRLPFGAVPGFGPICLDSNDPQTVKNGFLKRLMRDVPECDPARLAKLTAFVDKFLREHVAPVRAMEFEEWLDSTTYDNQRKDQLRAAFEDLRGGRPTRKQCSHVDIFVKTESYLEYKNCRMINSRHDAFKAYSGRFFKAIEEEVYKLKPFIKHTPVPDRPALIRALKKAGRHYYQTDYTAYESHFLKKIMRALELQLYRWCLQNYPEDADLICKTISGINCMRTRTGVRANVEARRMSGDMCTSLGNGFSNLMVTMFLISEGADDYEGFVEGDDGLFSTTCALSAKDYELLGFTIKIEEVTDPCEASFCGMVFSESGEIVKDPAKFLSTFGWTHSFISAGTVIMEELLKAKALSAIYECPQCPILGVLSRVALAKVANRVARFEKDEYHVIPVLKEIPEYCPSASTRLLFQTKFGVSVEAQLRIEAMIYDGKLSDIWTLFPPTNDMLAYTSNYISVG